MSSFPLLVRSVSPSGEARYSLGDPFVDRYLEFVAGRHRRPEPLPKFLDDRDAARLMAGARAAADPRDRLVVEVLARTGLRATELCDLDADAVVLIGDATGYASPSASCATTATSRFTPELVTLFAEWTAANSDHIRRHRRLIADHRGALADPLDGYHQLWAFAATTAVVSGVIGSFIPRPTAHQPTNLDQFADELLVVEIVALPLATDVV